MLNLTRPAYEAIVGHAYDGLPLEACGLLLGDGGPIGGAGSDSAGAAKAVVFYPCTNLAASSRVYTLDPKDFLRADRMADDQGLSIIGVVHSHTHTEAYPSPTDVQQAPDPAWHYVIVSLRAEAPVLRSYRIVDGRIAEESVSLVPR